MSQTTLQWMPIEVPIVDYQDIGQLNSKVNDVQIGFTQLPDSASQLHFNFLQKCLNDCDAHHPECQPQQPALLPTRLMHIGTKASSVITLYETKPKENLRYIALSHPWGKPPHFRTTPANVEAYRKRIKSKRLPPMFKDAVAATRRLGLQYLWIDSICIIQGDGGDFDEESKRMEDVFSNAFCVIAACSAEGQNERFLDRRIDPRQCLTFGFEGQPALYLSRFNDDFERDVLESPLSQRGWVLQERVLARRTIHFTNGQTYFECGKGVRCETLTKMDK